MTLPPNARKKQVYEWATSEQPLFSAVYYPSEMDKPLKQRSMVVRSYCCMNNIPQKTPEEVTQQRTTYNQYHTKYRTDNLEKVREIDKSKRKKKEATDC